MAVLMRFIPRPGMFTYRSRGKETAVTVPVDGVMVTIIIISVRYPPPARASDPRTMTRNWLPDAVPMFTGESAVGMLVGVLDGSTVGVAVAVGRFVGRGVGGTGWYGVGVWVASGFGVTNIYETAPTTEDAASWLNGKLQLINARARKIKTIVFLVVLRIYRIHFFIIMC